eukprot:gene23247-30133_t
MIDIFENYCTGSNSFARFLTIYIDEAHASDEWWLPHSPGTEKGGKAYIRSHRSIEERISAATKFVKDLNFPIDVVCDSFDNQVYTYYQCSPERLYIVQDGVIVYQGGVGPFDYKLAEVKDWLSERFGLRGSSISRR